MSVTLRTTVRTLSALLLGFGLMQMGNTLQGTLLSLRATIEGFSSVQVGAIGAGFWGGIVIGSLCGGALIRRIGHIRTFAALGAIASTVPLLHLLLINPAGWVLARALTGFCFAGLFIVVESWFNGAATMETRGQVLSIYGMTGLMAGIGGQLLLPATDYTGFAPFCIVAIILAYALVPIVVNRSTAPAMTDDGAARINLIALNRQAPFGVVAAFLSGATGPQRNKKLAEFSASQEPIPWARICPCSPTRSSAMNSISRPGCNVRRVMGLSQIGLPCPNSQR